jgi:hypothetical protein
MNEGERITVIDCSSTVARSSLLRSIPPPVLPAGGDFLYDRSIAHSSYGG